MIVTQGYDNSQRIVTCGFGGSLAVTAPIPRYGGFKLDKYTPLDDAAEIVLMMYWNYRRRKA